jgi:uncharacterized protein
MTQHLDDVDLSSLRLTSGEGRRLDLPVRIDALELAGERYRVPGPLVARLDVSRTTGEGYALRLRFTAALSGPCMRCLVEAAPAFEVDAREVFQPGEGEELESPYVTPGSPTKLDLGGWARDALVLAVGGAPILCRPDCAGLCAVCGADLNEAGPEHHHESGPDPRWAKLSEIRFD